jgi:hypothetical protein
VFGVFAQVLAQNGFVVGAGSFQQFGKDVILDLQVLFCGQYVPLVHDEMVVVKAFEK